MTRVEAGVAETVATGTPVSTVPSTSEGAQRADTRLRLVRRVAWVLFTLQFIGLALWSALMFSRFAITNDGGQYLQGMYLISHGHLNPMSTVQGYPVLKDHFTLAWWPLSLVDLIPPHGLFLLWLQDAAMVAAEVIAFQWMCHVVDNDRLRQVGRWWPAALAALGCLVLVCNPWTPWSTSFDLHIEPFACPLLVGAAYDFMRGRRRRPWVLVGLVLLFGDVTATWVLGLAISAFLAAFFSRDRRLLRTGGILVGVGVLWLGITAAVGVTGSVLNSSYGYLAVGAGQPIPSKLTVMQLVRSGLEHPGRLLGALWGHRLNVLADVGPAGWIGALTTWTFGVPFVIMFENNTTGFGAGVFSIPSFQAAPVYELTAIGIVIIFAWWVTRFAVRRALAVGMLVLLVANVITWAVIWTPQVKQTWLRVSAPQARVLDNVAKQIPTGDEVVASQGVIGRFANRLDAYDLTGPSDNSEPVHGSTVWFIVMPNSGIQTQPVDAALATVSKLAGPMHAQLVVAKDGIYAFKWKRPSSVHTVRFPDKPTSIAAWIAVGSAGVSERHGPLADWYTSSTGASGYVIAGDYWRRPLGDYQASITLSSSATTYLEVWDTNANILLARNEIPTTNGRERITVPFRVQKSYPGVTSYAGWGPFHIQPVPAPPGEVLEVRLYQPSGGSVTAYRVGLTHGHLFGDFSGGA